MKITYDLHMHSCLSLCAEDDCTPASIAGMAYLSGIDAFAITDHQSALNCTAAVKAAQAYGLIAVPGMELTTSEEVHVLCLFRTLEEAISFSEYVGDRLMLNPKKGRVTWRQTVMDERDNPISEVERWLGSPADIGVYEVSELCKRYNGIAIPAHIDRPSSSLLSNLGLYDENMGFSVCEVTRTCDLDALLAQHPQLATTAFIRNSDAHELAAIEDAGPYTIEVKERTAAAVIDALIDMGRRG